LHVESVAVSFVLNNKSDFKSDPSHTNRRRWRRQSLSSPSDRLPEVFRPDPSRTRERYRWYIVKRIFENTIGLCIEWHDSNMYRGTQAEAGNMTQHNASRCYNAVVCVSVFVATVYGLGKSVYLLTQRWIHVTQKQPPPLLATHHCADGPWRKELACAIQSTYTTDPAHIGVVSAL
jgi:hypothetical protein